MFLRCFLHLSLVNLPLLASLEERSTYGVLGCFLEVGDGDDFKEVLVDEAARDVLPYSGRPQQDQRWKLSLASESETQGHLSPLSLYGGICSHIPSSSDQ